MIETSLSDTVTGTFAHYGTFPVLPLSIAFRREVNTVFRNLGYALIRASWGRFTRIHAVRYSGRLEFDDRELFTLRHYQLLRRFVVPFEPLTDGRIDWHELSD